MDKSDLMVSNIEKINTVLPTVEEASKAFLKLSITAESHKRRDKATVTDKRERDGFVA